MTPLYSTVSPRTSSPTTFFNGAKATRAGRNLSPMTENRKGERTLMVAKRKFRLSQRI